MRPDGPDDCGAMTDMCYFNANSSNTSGLTDQANASWEAMSSLFGPIAPAAQAGALGVGEPAFILDFPSAISIFVMGTIRNVI
jgi:hypothetical protein